MKGKKAASTGSRPGSQLELSFEMEHEALLQDAVIPQKAAYKAISEKSSSVGVSEPSASKFRKNNCDDQLTLPLSGDATPASAQNIASSSIPEGAVADKASVWDAASTTSEEASIEVPFAIPLPDDWSKALPTNFDAGFSKHDLSPVQLWRLQESTINNYIKRQNLKRRVKTALKWIEAGVQGMKAASLLFWVALPYIVAGTLGFDLLVFYLGKNSLIGKLIPLLGNKPLELAVLSLLGGGGTLVVRHLKKKRASLKEADTAPADTNS